MITKVGSKDIFIYNEENSLAVFVAYNCGILESFYKLEGRRLTKKYTNYYDGIPEIKKSIVDYEENVVLQHLYIMGESCINATSLGTNHVTRAAIKDRVLSSDGSLETFKIKPKLVQRWLSTLNMSGVST